MSQSEKADLLDASAASHATAKAEARRGGAVALLQMLYRLTKACLLHSDSNQAVLSLVPSAIDSIVEYCELAGTSAATVVFAGDTVFINGQLLRTSRETYDVVRELSGFFEVCSVAELVIEKTVRRAELAAFARYLADAQRDRGVAARLLQCTLRGIRISNVGAAPGEGGAAPDASLVVRVSRAYAAAILVMRAFYASLRAGETALPQRVKRIAQKLVSAAEEDARLLLSLPAARIGDPDEAGMCVSTAIVALSIARQITSDRRMLTALATAALLYDAGKLRLASAAGQADADPNGKLKTLLERTLNEDEKERLPQSEAVMLTALGKLHAPSIMRTVIAYEALALRASHRVGPLYGGRRHPAVLSRVLAAAREFSELRMAHGATAAPSLDDVLHAMLDRAESATERAVVKLLVCALGFFPTGTLVELNTGELGVVLGAPALPARFAQPPVRILYDAQGRPLDAPFDVDLSATADGAPPHFIVRPVDVEPHHAKAIRAAMADNPLTWTLDSDARPNTERAPNTEPHAGPAWSSRDNDPTPDVTHRGAEQAPNTEPRPSSLATTEELVPPTEPGRSEERVRGGSSRAEAAWLGRPLSSAASVPRPPPAGPPAAQLDRAARLDRSRAEELISTQPPPSTAAAEAPAVPRPPRLPRDSLRPATSAFLPDMQPMALRGGERPRDRDAVNELPTIGPPPPESTVPSRRPPEPRERLSGRSLDVRADPEGDFVWDGELPTMEPPPPTTSPSPQLGIDATLRDYDLPAAVQSSYPEAFDDTDATWIDELPTIDPPPPSAPLLERDRILAAYLAERTPRPRDSRAERARALERRLASEASPLSSPPSSRRAPGSRPAGQITPQPFSSKRVPHVPIPREEPPEDTIHPAPPKDRDRS